MQIEGQLELPINESNDSVNESSRHAQESRRRDFSGRGLKIHPTSGLTLFAQAPAGGNSGIEGSSSLSGGPGRRSVGS